MGWGKKGLRGGGGGGFEPSEGGGGGPGKGLEEDPSLGSLSSIHSLFLWPLELGIRTFFYPKVFVLKILTILWRIHSWMKITKKNVHPPLPNL